MQHASRITGAIVVSGVAGAADDGARGSGAAHFRIESHEGAAVLHVAGALTTIEAMRALRLCEELPGAVRELRVDLRAARYADTTPVQTIALLLARWRRAQPGRQSRIDLPPTGQRPAPTPPRPRPKLTGRRGRSLTRA